MNLVSKGNRTNSYKCIGCGKGRVELGTEDKMETREEIKYETAKIKGHLSDIMETIQ